MTWGRDFQPMYHHTAVNGGGVVVGLNETRDGLEAHVVKDFNVSVETKFATEMKAIDRIVVTNDEGVDAEATRRTKAYYKEMAETKSNSSKLKVGKELKEGDIYQRINPVFTSDDHALMMVHGNAARIEGSFAYTADGQLSDGAHASAEIAQTAMKVSDQSDIDWLKSIHEKGIADLFADIAPPMVRALLKRATKDK